MCGKSKIAFQEKEEKIDDGCNSTGLVLVIHANEGGCVVLHECEE